MSLFLALFVAYHQPDGVNDAGNGKHQGENDIDKEVFADAYLKKCAQRRQEKGKNKVEYAHWMTLPD